MKLLQNDRVSLRALEPTDIDTLLYWENDTELWPVGCTVAPFSRHLIWEYLQNYDTDIYKTRQLRLMIIENETQQPVGTIDLYDFNPFHMRAFVGILVDRKYRNRGYGKNALRLLIDYTGSFLGLHQLAAVISTSNTTSLHMFDKIGFHACGTLKQWLHDGDKYADAVIMQFIFGKHFDVEQLEPTSK